MESGEGRRKKVYPQPDPGAAANMPIHNLGKGGETKPHDCTLVLDRSSGAHIRPNFNMGPILRPITLKSDINPYI